MAKSRLPTLRYHRASGLAVVTLSGHDHYLGPWGSPDVGEKYNAIVARWIAGGKRPLAELDRDGPDGPAALTVGGLADRHAAHVLATYTKRGKPTTHALRVARVLGTLRTMYGGLPARQFGRVEFVAFRNYLVVQPGEDGAIPARSTVNQYADLVRFTFRWAAENGLVPASVWHDLAVVRRLAKGRTAARETPRVTPPGREAVDAVRPLLAAQVRAMVDVQLLTGMRPGEVCGLTPNDLDRRGAIWHYCVSADVNKSEHRDVWRIVSIGPRAQAVLAPWVALAERLRGREGPVFVGRNGAAYTPGAYNKAVASACRRAGLAEGDRWTPNGLRHFAGTAVRARFGVEAAQAVLGHSDVKTTQIYAEVDTSAADRVASEMG